MKLSGMVLLLLALPAQAQDKKPAGKLDQAKVDQAIAKAVQFLKPVKSPDTTSGFLNTDELILWTLLHAGVPETDPRFKELLDSMLNAPLEKTYKVSLQAMILEELDRVRYLTRIFHCAQFLVDNQLKSGAWSYGTPTTLPDPPSGTPTPAGKEVKTGAPRDLAIKGGKPKVLMKLTVKRQRDGSSPEEDASNSQYAALGVRACHDAGIVFPSEMIEKARKRWIETQDPAAGKAGDPKTANVVVSRGWGYQARGPSSPMTAGAIGAVVIYDYMLGLDWKKEKGLQDAWSWLANPFSVRVNMANGKVWDYSDPDSFVHYYLYALERAGILYGTERVGPHDWYAEGAKFLLETQKADGSWGSEGTYNHGTVWDTCFAVLFLRRATRPLVVSEDKFLKK